MAPMDILICAVTCFSVLTSYQLNACTDSLQVTLLLIALSVMMEQMSNAFHNLLRNSDKNEIVTKLEAIDLSFLECQLLLY